ETSDNGFIVSGSEISFSNGDVTCQTIFNDDAWIVKLAYLPLDAKVNLITYPSLLLPIVCDTVFNPFVEIQNIGVDTLTSVDILCQVDAGIIQTDHWTGSLAQD